MKQKTWKEWTGNGIKVLRLAKTLSRSPWRCNRSPLSGRKHEQEEERRSIYRRLQPTDITMLHISCHHYMTFPQIVIEKKKFNMKSLKFEKIGYLTTLSVNIIIWSIDNTSDMKASFLIMTPLGSPVVPLVYIIVQMSVFFFGGRSHSKLPWRKKENSSVQL